MNEIVEGLRGPALGVVVLIIILAGTIVTAAFAALIAQMSLLMRLRSQGAVQTRANSDHTNKVVETRRSPSSSFRRSPRNSVIEQANEEVVEGVWWQEES